MEPYRLPGTFVSDRSIKRRMKYGGVQYGNFGQHIRGLSAFSPRSGWHEGVVRRRGHPKWFVTIPLNALPNNERIFPHGNTEANFRGRRPGVSRDGSLKTVGYRKNCAKFRENLICWFGGDTQDDTPDDSPDDES